MSSGECRPAELDTRHLTLDTPLGGEDKAYASPEQVNRERLTAKTDQWSWAVSVLEMFKGRVTWPSGAVAPQVLEAYLKAPDGVPVPASMAEVLRRAFQRDPAERWPNMAQAADDLVAAYRHVIGKPYGRTKPAAARTGPAHVAAHDRRTTDGVTWADPRTWLERAFAAAGRDPRKADRLIPPRHGSRKVQAIADLAAYEEALHIYERLIAAGRKDLREDLANLSGEKAFVHESAEDLPGAVAQYDRAIEIRERLVNQEGRRELANDLADTYQNKAIEVATLGDNRAAVDLYDRAIAVYERLVNQEGRRELRGDLARTTVYRAKTLLTLGEQDRARADARRAVAVLKEEVEQTGRADLKAVLDWAQKALKDVL